MDAYHDRLDIAFLNSIRSVENRLRQDSEVMSPIAPYDTLLYTQEDHTKVENLRKRLAKYIEKLEVLDKDDCTYEDAMNAWRDFFSHDYWETKKNGLKYEVSSKHMYRNTEEFIESMFPVDAEYSVRIDCRIEQDGFRPQLLSRLLGKGGVLKVSKSLTFFIESNNVPCPYEVYWKVRNVGELALKKDMIRGQILKTNRGTQCEISSFGGAHFVECYVIKNGVCLARDRIEVPISGCIG
jgi:hypothetical protein